MANEEQLSILKQGVDVWNKWKEKNPFTPVDLASANLSGVLLQEADLSSAVLTGANLHRADLSGSNLKAAKLNGANLSHAFLSKVDLFAADLRSADLRNAHLFQGHLRSADFTDAYLTGADLRSANFKSANLSGADLTDANLDGASLVGTADVTNPKSSLLELQATVPDYQIPFVPIIQEGEQPFAMMVDLQKKYNWVLDTLSYRSIDELIKSLKPAIIDPAIQKHNELRLMKAREPKIRSASDFIEDKGLDS